MTALAVAAAGCSAGVTTSPTDPHSGAITTTIPVTTTTIAVGDALETYRDCLADQGVALEEISTDARGRPRMALALAELDLSDGTVLAALEACGHIMASGLLDLAADPELRSMVRAQLEELAECIRAGGVEDFPDPVLDFDGVGPPFPVNLIPWSDPALTDAMADCSPIGGQSP